MDLSHPVCNEPDQTDEGSSQTWLFFGPYHLDLYQKDIQVNGHKILLAWPVNENGVGMKKSANPKLAKKLGISARKLSKEEIEDYGLSIAISEGKTGEYIE